jgi:four helix bundle suffix protein
MTDNSDRSSGSLIPRHGGYRKLKSFQMSQLVYDVTVRFCDRYVSKKSRTHDQMVQAARSGVQNIAEGSQASGTSKKTELKLTNVARASLEELKLDFEDFLRQHDLPLWSASDYRRKNLVDRRCKTADEVAAWVQEQHTIQTRPVQNNQNEYSGQYRRNGHNGPMHGYEPVNSSQSFSTSIKSIVSLPSRPESYSCLAANAALVLIGVTCSLLDRQIKALADKFEQEGGFTERLYKTRQSRKNI